jgi:hypothetical protein
MDAFYKAHPHLVGRTKATKKQLKEQREKLWQEHQDGNDRVPKADLAWHVRAWGRWVLDHARRELAAFYPTYADFEALDKHSLKPFEKRPMQLVPLKDDGTPNIDALNKEFSPEYLADKRNPRWIAKPTVAYFWARTVTCKNCRATIPLLKTRWLCKKDKKRVLLTMDVVDAASSPRGFEANIEASEKTRRDGASTLKRRFVKSSLKSLSDCRRNPFPAKKHWVSVFRSMASSNGRNSSRRASFWRWGRS